MPSRSGSSKSGASSERSALPRSAASAPKYHTRCFESPDHGLPIGSLTSQHFANFYLGWLDRYVKENLRLGGYVRYMDDMILWDDDRQRLEEVHRLCSAFVAGKLSLEFKPAAVRRVSAGINYLGCRIWPTHVELNRRSKRRWRNRVRVLERAERLGLISERELQARLTALTAFAKGAGVKSWRFRKSVL